MQIPADRHFCEVVVVVQFSFLSSRQQLIQKTMSGDKFNLPKQGKRITAVMMIRAGFKDMNVIAGACMGRNTVKTFRAKLVEVENKNEDVVNRKKRKRRSDSLWTPDDIEKLQRKVVEDPSKSATKLAEEMGVGSTTTEVCINQDLRFNFYKRCKGQILTQKAPIRSAQPMSGCPRTSTTTPDSTPGPLTNSPDCSPLRLILVVGRGRERHQQVCL